jgi:hypothetical protein
MQASIWVGFDPKEAAAFAVAVDTIKRHLSRPIPVFGLVLDECKRQGLFWRPQEQRQGRTWDVISDAPCATEFSISRFLTPHLARQRVAYMGAPAWALFLDCDMLVNADLASLFDTLDERHAVACVKHHHEPPEGLKMDGQLQVTYARKNWSSLCAYNLRHASNATLTVEMINTVPGRDLHRFAWLKDEEIGELPAVWNWFPSFGKPNDGTPKVVHFTDGLPFHEGHEDDDFADDWRAALNRWAAC